MSQTELAHRLGAIGLPFRHQPRITQLEAGNRILTREEAEAIAEVLDVDVMAFFEGTDDERIAALEAQQAPLIDQIKSRQRQAIQLRRRYEREMAELEEQTQNDMAKMADLESQKAEIENGDR